MLGLRDYDPFAAIEEKLEREERKDEERAPHILQKAHDKGVQAAAEQFFKTLYLRQFVNDFMSEGTLPLGIQLKDEYKALTDKAFIQNSTKSPYYLVTVNPRPDVTFEQLDKVVKKIVKKKTIIHHAYVYEIRGQTDDGDYTGLHCHMLLYNTIKPYDFKKGIKSTVKHICDYNNPNILNFKNIEPDVVSQKYQYLLGDKTDKKLAGVNLTNEWRQANQIDQIYESIPPLPCRDTQNLLETEEVKEDEEDN